MEKSAIAQCLKQIAARTVRVIEDDNDEAGTAARIFTRHITEVTDTIRTHLRTTATAESVASQSETVLWLPGWDRETRAPLWFRADAVDSHKLHDFNGKANGISYNAKEDDKSRRSAWASAKDFRGHRREGVRPLLRPGRKPGMGRSTRNVHIGRHRGARRRRQSRTGQLRGAAYTMVRAVRPRSG